MYHHMEFSIPLEILQECFQLLKMPGQPTELVRACQAANLEAMVAAAVSFIVIGALIVVVFWPWEDES